MSILFLDLSTVFGGLPIRPVCAENSSSLLSKPTGRLLSTDEDLEELLEPPLELDRELDLEENRCCCCCFSFFFMIYSVGSNLLNGGAELGRVLAGDIDRERLPALPVDDVFDVRALVPPNTFLRDLALDECGTGDTALIGLLTSTCKEALLNRRISRFNSSMSSWRESISLFLP